MVTEPTPDSYYTLYGSSLAKTVRTVRSVFLSVKCLPERHPACLLSTKSNLVGSEITAPRARDYGSLDLTGRLS